MIFTLSSLDDRLLSLWVIFTNTLKRLTLNRRLQVVDYQTKKWKY